MDIFETDKQYVIQNNNRFGLAIKNGKGAVCFDYDGKGYIDFTAGIGVNALGYAPDVLIKAVTEQVSKLQHTSNLYYNEPYIRLAEAVCSKTGYAKAFFCNSGAEANEAVIKLMRKYSYDKYGEGAGRYTIITLAQSFHGRTMTTLTATGQPAMHKYFMPLSEGFRYTQANDFDAFSEAATDDVCGVIIEPVQGEGGVIPLEADFAKRVAEYCRNKDILLACDEIQTGLGRTGTLLAQEQLGIKADIVSLAKALGGGLPIGAILANEKCADVFGFGDHGTTFGGNPVVCAGAKAVFDVISDQRFLDGVKAKAHTLRSHLNAVPDIVEVSGLGLMVGITVPEGVSARAVAQKCIENGLLVLTAKDKVRLLPPLNITNGQIEQGVRILAAVLKELKK